MKATSLLSGSALLLCAVLAVVQVNHTHVRRSALLGKPADDAAKKGPVPVPVITGNGFGTNSAFMGQGDGQGTSVKGLRTQQLLMPHRFDPAYKSPVHIQEAGSLGTNRAFLNKYDGAGQSTKAPAQMLAEKQAFPTVWEQIGAPDPHAEAHGLMTSNDNFGYKSKVQMLAQNDGAGQSTKVQMLAQNAPAPTVWQSIGVPSPSAAAQAAMQGSDDFGYKASPQMLFQQNKARIPLPPLGSDMGTNRAFLGKYDGAGQSTRGTMQSLLQHKQGPGGQPARTVAKKVTGWLFKKPATIGL